MTVCCEVGLIAIDTALIPGWTLKRQNRWNHMLAEISRQICDYLYFAVWIRLPRLDSACFFNLTLSSPKKVAHMSSEPSQQDCMLCCLCTPTQHQLVSPHKPKHWCTCWCYDSNFTHYKKKKTSSGYWALGQIPFNKAKYVIYKSCWYWYQKWRQQNDQRCLF